MSVPVPNPDDHGLPPLDLSSWVGDANLAQPLDFNALFNPTAPIGPAPAHAPDSAATLAVEGARLDLIPIQGSYPVLSARIQLTPQNIIKGIGLVGATIGTVALIGLLADAIGKGAAKPTRKKSSQKKKKKKLR